MENTHEMDGPGPVDLALVFVLAYPAQACLTRMLNPPAVLDAYMKHTLGKTNDPLGAARGRL